MQVMVMVMRAFQLMSSAHCRCTMHAVCGPESFSADEQCTLQVCHACRLHSLELCTDEQHTLQVMGDGSEANGEGNKFTADLMDQFFRDPNMQQLLYKYLPEPMRNPQTFEWMLSNPEYRKQLEGMMEQQVTHCGPPDSLVARSCKLSGADLNVCHQTLCMLHWRSGSACMHPCRQLKCCYLPSR